MRQWGQKKYRAGAVWRCERIKGNEHLTEEYRAKEMARGKFNFVIIGPGKKKGTVLCRLECDDPKAHMHNMTQDYSHRHLNKYAEYVSERPSDRQARIDANKCPVVTNEKDAMVVFETGSGVGIDLTKEKTNGES